MNPLYAGIVPPRWHGPLLEIKYQHESWDASTARWCPNCNLWTPYCEHAAAPY